MQQSWVIPGKIHGSIHIKFVGWVSHVGEGRVGIMISIEKFIAFS